MAQSVEYYHLDAIGSVRAVSDSSGQVVERHVRARLGIVETAVRILLDDDRLGPCPAFGFLGMFLHGGHSRSEKDLLRCLQK